MKLYLRQSFKQTSILCAISGLLVTLPCILAQGSDAEFQRIRREKLILSLLYPVTFVVATVVQGVWIVTYPIRFVNKVVQTKRFYKKLRGH